MEEKEINTAIHGEFNEIRYYFEALNKKGDITKEEMYYMYCKLSSMLDEESQKYI